MSNGPCWEGPDVGLRARVRLADGGPGVALNVREQRSGCAEACLLIGTMRAPISAIEFDARCREVPGQPARVIGFCRLGAWRQHIRRPGRRRPQCQPLMFIPRLPQTGGAEGESRVPGRLPGYGPPSQRPRVSTVRAGGSLAL